MNIKTPIYISIGVLMAALLIPVAFNAIYDANTTVWNAAVVTIFQVLLPVLAIIGIALGFMTFGKKD